MKVAGGEADAAGTRAERAFAREALIGRVAPFAASAAIAVGLAFLEFAATDPAWLAVGAILSVAAIASALVVPWERLPSALDAIPPLIYIGAAAVLRHATGGGDSGFSPLFLVPVLWLALFGTRGQVVAGLVAVAVALIVPIVVVGDPAYPLGEWRRLVNLIVVGAMIGFIVQRLVGQLHRQARTAVFQSRELADQRDVNEAILDAASDAVVSFDWAGTVVAVNTAAEALFGRRDLLGRDLFETLVPEHESARLRDGLGRILVAEAPSERAARFEADLRRGDGSLVPAEISVVRTDGTDGMHIHAFVRDATARRAAEAGAKEHLEDLDRLLLVARELDRSDERERDAICAAARDLVGCDFVLFYTPGESGTELVIAGAAADASVPRDITLHRERSIVGMIMASGATRFSGELAADPAVDPGTVRRLGAASAYWQPVVIDHVPVGVLVAYWRHPLQAVPERVVTLLGLFAAQAATVIERADLLARLEGLARTDALTGAANRRALADALAVAVADAHRTDRPLSVVMLDLDHFKHYNDGHGHQAGDQLLRTVADAWMHELRPGDLLARYGGEEFLAVLQSCDAPGARIVADRLRAVVPGPQTASAGTATWDGEESVESLVGRADAALYRAKRAGRDRTVAADDAAAPGARP